MIDMRTTTIILVLSVLLLLGCMGAQQNGGSQSAPSQNSQSSQSILKITENDITPQGNVNDSDLLSTGAVAPPLENESVVAAPVNSSPSINESDISVSGEPDDSDVMSTGTTIEAPQ